MQTDADVSTTKLHEIVFNRQSDRIDVYSFSSADLAKSWFDERRVIIVSRLRLYAPVNCVNIGSGNGLCSVRRQSISRTSADLLLMWPLGTNFYWNLNQNTETSIEKKAFKNVAF